MTCINLTLDILQLTQMCVSTDLERISTFGGVYLKKKNYSSIKTMLTVSKNREQVCMSQFAGQAVRKLLKDPLGRQLRCK